ncbi:MAG: hypothetical protein M0024_09485 [Nitrospiraceae bacterium]|nr:hypothetical protein [Nitrospiraceae bacterium]
MKRILGNEQGIALVMVLIFSMIGLAIVSAMLLMITKETLLSGQNRQFRSADEAGLAGAGVAMDFVKNNGSPPSGMAPTFYGPTVDPAFAACLAQKMSTSRGDWTTTTTNWTACTAAYDISLDPTLNPDMYNDVQGNGTNPDGSQKQYRVYTKIVDTVKGNTESSLTATGGGFGGTGTSMSNSGIVTPPSHPSMYRMEVQTQDVLNPNERSRYSVLYAN